MSTKVVDFDRDSITFDDGSEMAFIRYLIYFLLLLSASLTWAQSSLSNLNSTKSTTSITIQDPAVIGRPIGVLGGADLQKLQKPPVFDVSGRVGEGTSGGGDFNTINELSTEFNRIYQSVESTERFLKKELFNSAHLGQFVQKLKNVREYIFDEDVANRVERLIKPREKNPHTKIERIWQEGNPIGLLEVLGFGTPNDRSFKIEFKENIFENGVRKYAWTQPGDLEAPIYMDSNLIYDVELGLPQLYGIVIHELARKLNVNDDDHLLYEWIERTFYDVVELGNRYGRIESIAQCKYRYAFTGSIASDNTSSSMLWLRNAIPGGLPVTTHSRIRENEQRYSQFNFNPPANFTPLWNKSMMLEGGYRVVFMYDTQMVTITDPDPKPDPESRKQKLRRRPVAKLHIYDSENKVMDSDYSIVSKTEISDYLDQSEFVSFEYISVSIDNHHISCAAR